MEFTPEQIIESNILLHTTLAQEHVQQLNTTNLVLFYRSVCQGMEDYENFMTYSRNEKTLREEILDRMNRGGVVT